MKDNLLISHSFVNNADKDKIFTLLMKDIWENQALKFLLWSL